MAHWKWTREKILDELRRLHRDGYRMTAHGLRAAGQGRIIKTAHNAFGTFTAARRAAGVPTPALLPPPLKWTRDEVIATIQARAQRNRPLNLKAAPKKLVAAAARRFGTWDAALEASGLDPTAVRLAHPKWSREDIIARIKAGAKSGRTGVGPSGFIDRATYSVAVGRFGTIRAAIAAAGLDAEILMRWSPAREPALRAKVEQLARAHPKMTLTEFHDHSLGRAVRERVGSVKRAMALWGVHDWPIPAHATAEPRADRGYWNAKRVLAEIRARHRKSQPLAKTRAPARLVTAGKTYLGSWRTAIERAGLDYTKILLGPSPKKKRPPKRTREDITLIIAARAKANRPLNARAVPKALHNWATRLFGTWDAALEAAGLDPALVRKARPERTRHDIIAAIRQAAKEKRLALSPSLAKAARHHFGTVETALTAAGVDATLHRSRPYLARLDMHAIRARVERLARTRPTMTIAELREHALGRLIIERLGTVEAALSFWNVRGWPTRTPDDAPRAQRREHNARITPPTEISPAARRAQRRSTRRG